MPQRSLSQVARETESALPQLNQIETNYFTCNTSQRPYNNNAHTNANLNDKEEKLLLSNKTNLKITSSLCTSCGCKSSSKIFLLIFASSSFFSSLVVIKNRNNLSFILLSSQ